MGNVRVRASADEIAKSLQGNWRAEHLFALKQALGAFDFVGTRAPRSPGGGKVMSGKTKRVANRAAQALRLAAAALRSSKPALGGYFRRMCSRMDKPKAVTAAAKSSIRLLRASTTSIDMGNVARFC